MGTISDILKISTVLLVMVMASCERPDDVARFNPEKFDVEDHIVIGKALKREIMNMPDVFPVLKENQYRKAYNYITVLMNTLKTTSEVENRNEFDWDITIIQDDEVKNAFTVPGGHIFIYTGLLKFLNAENELMAILGNEMAYADKGFTLDMLKEEFGGVLLGDIILGNKVPLLPDIVEDLPFIVYIEEDVLEADEFSIELVCPFNYDAMGLKTFLEKAHQEDISWVHSKNSNIEDRLERIEEQATGCGEEELLFEERYSQFLDRDLP